MECDGIVSYRVSNANGHLLCDPRRSSDTVIAYHASAWRHCPRRAQHRLGRNAAQDRDRAHTDGPELSHSEHWRPARLLTEWKENPEIDGIRVPVCPACGPSRVAGPLIIRSLSQLKVPALSEAGTSPTARVPRTQLNFKLLTACATPEFLALFARQIALARHRTGARSVSRTPTTGQGL